MLQIDRNLFLSLLLTFEMDGAKNTLMMICSQVEYTNWNDNPKEPNGGEVENCLVVLSTSKWNDALCDENYDNFVCEKDQKSVIGTDYWWIGLNDKVIE